MKVLNRTDIEYMTDVGILFNIRYPLDSEIKISEHEHSAANSSICNAEMKRNTVKNLTFK